LEAGRRVSALAQAGLLDEEWLCVAPRVKGERKTLLSRRSGESAVQVDKNTAVTFWSRSASVLKSMTGKDSRLFMDWKGNHHEISAHL
jgi:hypothetical protein